MTETRLSYLFHLNIRGIASQAEKDDLILLIADEANKTEVNELMQEFWIDFHPKNPPFTLQKSSEILNNIIQNKENKTQVLKSKPTIYRTLWYKITAAAIVLLVIGYGVYFTLNHPSTQLAQHRNSTEITPGGNKAILTLNNGAKIILDQAKNGNLAAEGQVTVRKTNSGELIYDLSDQNLTKNDSATAYNTISTPRGGKYQVILTDGSHIWLNSASSITFPTAFKGNTRNVAITGEVYFEIAKNAKMPFHVKLKNDALIEVLGTHFNVMAYDDEESIKTTLLEGSVKIKQGNLSRIIIPGQQAQVRANKVIIDITDDVDIDEVTAWKRDMFQFNNADIETIMRQIARWYDVDVSFEGKPSTELLHGKISRNQNLTQVLKILELNDINFLVERRRIIVKQ